jgi:hypothetical protein
MRNVDDLLGTEPFSTDHLYLAAFLVCHGYGVLCSAIGTTNRVQFVFEDSPELRSTAANFMAGGKVDARQFSFALLKLKKNLPRNPQ